MKKTILAFGIILLFLCVTFTQVNASQVSDDYDSVNLEIENNQSPESNFQFRLFKKAHVNGTIQYLGQGIRGIFLGWPGVLPFLIHGINPNLEVEIMEPYQEKIVINSNPDLYIGGRFFALYAEWDIKPYEVDHKNEIWYIEGMVYFGRVACY